MRNRAFHELILPHPTSLIQHYSASTCSWRYIQIKMMMSVSSHDTLTHIYITANTWQRKKHDSVSQRTLRNIDSRTVEDIYLSNYWITPVIYMTMRHISSPLFRFTNKMFCLQMSDNNTYTLDHNVKPTIFYESHSGLQQNITRRTTDVNLLQNIFFFTP